MDIFRKKLDLETDRLDELIPEYQRNEGSRSDLDMEKQLENLTQDAVKRPNNALVNHLRVISLLEVVIFVPRTESTLARKKRKKDHATSDQKSLDSAIYELRAPGSSSSKLARASPS